MPIEFPKIRTLLLGSGPFAAELAQAVLAQPQCGYELVGVISAQAPATGTCGGLPILGCAEDLGLIIEQTNAECIFVAMPNHSELLPDHQLIEARVSRDIMIEDGEDVYEHFTGKLRLEALKPRSMIYNKELTPSRLAVAAARLMSFIVAVPALILLAPLLLLIALAVKLDSKGPALFVQERIGLGGKPFKLLKFRTMKPVAKTKSEWARDNSDRITRVGRVLRKYRLDELPQLINVLRGDMNLVGPRPHPASNFSLFVLVSRNTPECGFQIPYYSMRTLVRPGITGWAQVRYQYANNLSEEIEKLKFDLYYVKHYSILLDLRILFETAAVVFLGREGATDPDPLAVPAVIPKPTPAQQERINTAALQAVTAALEKGVAAGDAERTEKRPRLTAIVGDGPKVYAAPQRAAPRSNG